MNRRRIPRIAAMFLLALATVFSAFAQQPPWQPTPNDTLVSHEVHGDKRVTFRIYAPKATEAKSPVTTVRATPTRQSISLVRAGRRVRRHASDVSGGSKGERVLC
jgi:hypothetical protein